MKKRNLISALALSLTLGLVGCDGDTPSLGGGKTSDDAEESTSVNTGKVIHKDYSYLEGEPKPECIPYDAPKDYEGVNPIDVDPYDAYFFIAHKYVNSNSWAISKGQAIANVAGLGSYIQDIASCTVNQGTTFLNYFASAGSIKTNGSGAGINIPLVNKAARAFEDIDKGRYVGQQCNNGEDIHFNQDAKPGEFAATVDSWGATIDVNRQGLTDQFGHDLFTITAYNVPDRTAIKQANIVPEGDYLKFTFDFSLDENGGATDAAKYYRNTLNTSVAEGVFTFDVKQLYATFTVDDDWNIISSYSLEKYDIKVPMLGGITVEVVSETNCVYGQYDTLANCENEDSLRLIKESHDALIPDIYLEGLE